MELRVTEEVGAMRPIVVGISLNIEISMMFDEFRGGDTKHVASDYAMSVAGSSLNVGATMKKLSRNELPVTVVGTVGGRRGDLNALFVERELTDRGFTSHLLPVRTKTPLTADPMGTAAHLGLLCAKPPYLQDGARINDSTFEFGESMRRVERLMRDINPRCAIVTGVQPIPEEIAIVEAMLTHSTGLKVLSPSAKLVRENPDAFRGLAERSSILATNHVEAEMWLGETPTPANVARLHELGPDLVVVTCNRHGSIASERNGAVTTQAAHPVPDEKVATTAGAGDNFLGAFLVGKLQNWGIARCLRYASVSAALKIQRVGGSHTPTPDEVEQELNTVPSH